MAGPKIKKCDVKKSRYSFIQKLQFDLLYIFLRSQKQDICNQRQISVQFRNSKLPSVISLISGKKFFFNQVLSFQTLQFLTGLIEINWLIRLFFVTHRTAIVFVLIKNNVRFIVQGILCKYRTNNKLIVCNHHTTYCQRAENWQHFTFYNDHNACAALTADLPASLPRQTQRQSSVHVVPSHM